MSDETSDDPSFAPSSEDVDAATLEARRPSTPTRPKSRTVYPQEVKDAFSKFRAEYPNESIRRVLVRYKEQHNITLNEGTVKEWVLLDNLAHGRAPKARRGNPLKAPFLDFYQAHSNGKKRESVASVVTRFNEIHKTQIPSVRASDWVMHHGVSTGNGRKQKRARFLQFHEEYRGKVHLAKIIKMYNAANPSDRVSSTTAERWVKQAQTSTLGFVANERANDSDHAHQAQGASSSCARSPERALGPGGEDVGARQAPSRQAPDQPGERAIGFLDITFDSDELMADVDVVEEPSSSPAGTRPAPSRSSSEHGANQLEKWADSNEEEPLILRTGAGHVSLDAATRWIQAAHPSQEASSVGTRSPGRALGPGGEAPALGDVGARQAPSPQAPDQSGERAIEKEMLAAPPFDDFLDYLASTQSDPMLANIIMDSDDLLADVDVFEERSSSPAGTRPEPSEPLAAPPFDDFLDYLASRPTDPLVAEYTHPSRHPR